jgi:hypothetical protein
LFGLNSYISTIFMLMVDPVSGVFGIVFSKCF